MAAKKNWRDLSPRTRRMLIAAASAEAALRIATLVDIKRRPASEIRGRKWAWATVVALVSSGGLVPASYFIFGRRRTPPGA